MIAWTLDAELREHLRCPVTGGPLRDVPRGLYSPQADLLFPVVDGVPYLVRECALPPLSEERREPPP
jgi:uncharacterized protein YbaR (Trm112 family)